MNTTSKTQSRIRFLKRGVGMITATLILWGCLQGPWDYTPSDPPVHRGLFVSAYIFGGKKVEDVCVDRLYSLTEEFTNAFSFYESATVTLTGTFSDGSGSMTLSKSTQDVNCFMGPDNVFPVAGENYRLEGTISWDSSGNKVTSRFSSTSQVPRYFDILDSARAPSIAVNGVETVDTTGVVDSGGSVDSGNAMAVFQPLLQSFLSLPPQAQEELSNVFSIDSILVMAGANQVQEIAAYYASKEEDIRNVLRKYSVKYGSGDTLFYISGLGLNTMSHMYSVDSSEDVGTVLITRMYDSTARNPANSFDFIFNPKGPEAAQSYQPGNLNRLIVYPKISREGGWNLFDSLGVVNTWFFEGNNRLYFYGFDRFYYDYQLTTVDEENNPKVLSKSNVDNASGFFVGGLVDSFDVFIRLDQNTISFPLQEARAARCNDEGKSPFGDDEDYENRWYQDEDCAPYYREYCNSLNWNHPSCRADLIGRSMELSLNLDVLIDSLYLKDSTEYADSIKALLAAGLTDPNTDKGSGNAGKDGDEKKSGWNYYPRENRSDLGSQKEIGERMYCIAQNFPASAFAYDKETHYKSEGICEEVKQSCENGEKTNSCKSSAWDYCKKNKWQPAVCERALVLYCRDQEPDSPVLCREKRQNTVARTQMSPICK